MDNWKLVAKGKMRDRNAPVKWELYNIDDDRTELHDLAADYPQRVKMMSAKWNQYAHRTGVFPCPVREVKSKQHANNKSKQPKQNDK